MNTLQTEPRDAVPSSAADFVKKLEQERRLSWRQWSMLVPGAGLALAIIVGLAPGSGWDRVLVGIGLVLLLLGIWRRWRRRPDIPALGALLLDLGPKAVFQEYEWLFLWCVLLILPSKSVVSLYSDVALLLLLAGLLWGAPRRRRCLMERGVWDRGKFFLWEAFEGFEWGDVWKGAELKLWRRGTPGRLRRLGFRASVLLFVRPAQMAAVEAVISRFVPREGPLPPGLQPAGEQGTNQRGPQENPMPQNSPKP